MCCSSGGCTSPVRWADAGAAPPAALLVPRVASKGRASAVVISSTSVAGPHTAAPAVKNLSILNLGCLLRVNYEIVRSSLKFAVATLLPYLGMGTGLSRRRYFFCYASAISMRSLGPTSYLKGHQVQVLENSCPDRFWYWLARCFLCIIRYL